MHIEPTGISYIFIETWFSRFTDVDYWDIAKLHEFR